MRFLKRAWESLWRKPERIAAAPSLSDERRAKLKAILAACDALAYYPPTEVIFISSPCEKCMSRAIQLAMWKAELENELSELAAFDGRTGD